MMFGFRAAFRVLRNLAFGEETVGHYAHGIGIIFIGFAIGNGGRTRFIKCTVQTAEQTENNTETNKTYYVDNVMFTMMGALVLNTNWKDVWKTVKRNIKRCK
jgi:hypothetical protein